MRGHEALIALRRRGIRPVCADISVGMDDLGTWRDWQDWTQTAHIEIQPGDSIHRLDLRCLIGLCVSVGGTDAARVAAVHEACVSAGARTVMSAVYGWQRGELVCVDRIETLWAAA